VGLLDDKSPTSTISEEVPCALRQLNSRLGRGTLSHSGTYAWQPAIARESIDLLYKLTDEAWTPVGAVGLILGLRRCCGRETRAVGRNVGDGVG
jgi:hypothetical protein